MNPGGGPKFSVVVPVHNRGGLLLKALQSIEAQRHSNYEVIVVDDGSTEDLSPSLKQFESRITVIRQENAGPGAARNTGSQHARGKYLAFLDGDDVWFPWTLQTYADVLAGRPETQILLGQVTSFSDETELLQVSEMTASTDHYPDYLASAQTHRFVGGSVFCIERTAFDAVGGFTNRWINAEDHDLLLRLGVGAPVATINSPFTTGYRESPGTSISNLTRTIAGIDHLVSEEHAGGYPGGSPRRRERLHYLGRIVRPVVIAAVRGGRLSDAWRLYRQTLEWHIELRRWKFLIATPLLMLASLFRKPFKTAAMTTQAFPPEGEIHSSLSDQSCSTPRASG